MPILRTDHLFDQAERLISPPAAGRPRQVDLRRAISSAYYGVFHFTLTAMADEFVGVTQRNSGRYALIYRSLDHRQLKEICNDMSKQTAPQRYLAYLPENGLGANIQAFATAVVELQEKRHRADYNPQLRFRTSDAQLVIETARSAIKRFKRVNSDTRKIFLTLLLCSPR